jgi:hypothetical protein
VSQPGPATVSIHLGIGKSSGLLVVVLLVIDAVPALQVDQRVLKTAPAGARPVSR